MKVLVAISFLIMCAMPCLADFNLSNVVITPGRVYQFQADVNTDCDTYQYPLQTPGRTSALYYAILQHAPLGSSLAWFSPKANAYGEGMVQYSYADEAWCKNMGAHVSMPPYQGTQLEVGPSITHEMCLVETYADTSYHLYVCHPLDLTAAPNECTSTVDPATIDVSIAPGQALLRNSSLTVSCLASADISATLSNGGASTLDGVTVKVALATPSGTASNDFHSDINIDVTADVNAPAGTTSHQFVINVDYE
ncbi:hypothetical protein SME02_004934 [Klebsiella aerogenes]|nr:hypothetical protein [Klebsiella aerogenes]ELY3087837.1 hypothetical protein [Klebsiella aerogenes]